MTYHKHQVCEVVRKTYKGAMGPLVSKVNNTEAPAWTMKVTRPGELCKVDETIMVYESQIKPVRFKRDDTL